MTDLPNNSQPSATDELVARYEQGVANVSEGDILTWLNVRSEIEAKAEELTKEQLSRIEKADRQLIEKADAVAERIDLPAERSARSHPAEEWWWYLDAVAPAAEYVSAGKPTQTQQLLSWGFTGLQVVVLLVALFLIGRNLNIIPTPAPPTSTPFPSQVPSLTPTPNPAAYDMSTAKDVKSPDNVVEIKIPAAWQLQPAQQPYLYSFTYGDAANPQAFIQIQIDAPVAVYRIIGVTGADKTPRTALEEFVKTTPAESGFKFGAVEDAKLGGLDGARLTFSVQANPARGAEASELDLRYAALPNGDMVVMIVQFPTADAERARPAITAMLESLKINPQAIPTATPTATLHPLLMTATAVQKQILDLTPSPTPTLAPTSAATQQGTQAATQEAPAATPAATQMSTPEPTSAATAAQ